MQRGEVLQVVLRVSEYLSPLLMHYIEGINLLSP